MVPGRNPTSLPAGSSTKEPVCGAAPGRSVHPICPPGDPSGGALDGQDDPDLRSATSRRARLDRSAVELDEATRDRQAEATPRRARTAREPVEDMGQEIGRDSGPGVADGDLGLAAATRLPIPARANRPKADRPAGGRVAEGIRDEVSEDLADPDRIDVEQ